MKPRLKPLLRLGGGADAIAPTLEGGQGYPLLTDAGAVFAVQIVLTFTERVQVERRRIAIDGATMVRAG
jgi:hypothetical protein